MIAHFALTERGIQQGGDGSGQRARVVSGTELPGVAQKDGDHLAGFGSACREAASDGFYKLTVCCIRNAAIARGVDYGSFLWALAAGFKDDVVEEAATWIAVETGARHAQLILSVCGRLCRWQTFRSRDDRTAESGQPEAGTLAY